VNKVHVVGVRATKFEKPGRRKNDDGGDWDYPGRAGESGAKALMGAPRPVRPRQSWHRKPSSTSTTWPGQAVQIIGQDMTTDFETTFDATAHKSAGYDTNVRATRPIYDQTSLGPGGFQAIELQTVSPPMSCCAPGQRQAHDVTAATQHNIGLGRAGVVTAYPRAEH